MRRSNVVLIPALAQLNVPKLGIPTLVAKAVACTLIDGTLHSVAPLGRDGEVARHSLARACRFNTRMARTERSSLGRDMLGFSIRMAGLKCGRLSNATRTGRSNVKRNS